jgi:transposase-like protein
MSERSWTVECPWCDDGDYIDPRGERYRCAHCKRTNEVEVVPAEQLAAVVDDLKLTTTTLRDIAAGQDEAGQMQQMARDVLTELRGQS